MTGEDPAQAAVKKLRHAQDRLNACTYIFEAPERHGGGPLAGLTIALKDIIDQKGVVTTCGSGFYREVAKESAPVVDRIEGAGGRVVARTGLHEFAYGFSSENDWFGPVRNPWDPTTSPGGSSGGSAVAVAAGLVDAALGTDTGGSIRVPAAMTGVYGLKVTLGRVPVKGVFPLCPSLDTVGPLARDTRTLAALYETIAATGPTPAIDGKARLRIGVPQPWVEQGPTENAVASGFELALARLTEMGAEVRELDLPEMLPWGRIQELAGAEAAHVHRSFRQQGKPYGPEVGARLEAAEAVTPEQYLEAQAWRVRLVEVFAGAFQIVDLLATPAVAARRKVIGDNQIGDRAYRPVLSWFSALVNHAGNPAIALPIAVKTVDGPPPSIQLIAPWWREDMLLSMAASLEGSGVVGFIPPPIFYGDK